MSHTQQYVRTRRCSGSRGWASPLRRIVPVLLAFGLCQGAAWAAAPVGVVDSISTGTNGVSGWAYDPDTKSTSIDMQLKINGVLHVQGPANVYRSDVNAANGITGNHGFQYTFPDISSWSSFKADVYAMDSSGTGSTLIGTRYSVKVRTGASSATIKVDSTNYTADSSGNYFFHNITGGSSYTITPSKSGTCFSPASITRTITSGATPSDVVFTSGPCLSIAGSVGSSGVGATVSAGGKSATASSTGAYTISGLLAGSYTLTASKPACTFSPSSQSVTLSSANVTGKNFTTTCSYAIFGTVGVPGGGATVSAGGKSVTATSTGSYVITGLDTGTYTVTASKSGCTFTSLSVTLGPDATNKNLTATCSYSISGSVGSAAGGATISAGGKTAIASSTGAYTISGLGDGTHTVSALKSGCTFSPTSLPVTISGGNVTGKNFSATCAFSASGSVGSAGAGATLSAGGKTATASITGAYTITGLSPGTYTLTPSKANCSFSPASITGNIDSNQTGLNFTANCAYSVSGSVGSAAAGATLTAGGKTVTASATGAYVFTDLAPGTYTLTPSMAGCTFSPASFTGTVSSNLTGVDFASTCMPPLSTTIQEPTELRWTDVVTNVIPIALPTGSESFVIEIDLANLHKVKLYDSDPYWFKFYRGFFGNTPNSYKGIPLVTDESPPFGTSGCWSGMKNTGLPISGATGIIRVYQQCYGIVQLLGPNSSWQAVNHNMGAIGAYEADTSSFVVGTTYRIPGSPWNDGGFTISGSWRGLPTVTVDYGALFTPRYYQVDRTVLAGEVTSEGWGLVPLDPHPTGGWVWVKDAAKAWTPPPMDGSYPNLPSPYNWMQFYDYSGLSSKSNAFQQSGVALGLGEDITGNDKSREGFYIIGKNANGTWSRSEMVDSKTAMTYMKDSRSLVINGSGNSFSSAMFAMERIVEESGKPYSVAYYMPQSVGPASYLSASNSQMRSNLTEVFNKTAAEGWKLNVATHSWSGYVTTTTCANNCQNINHISFAPATMPSLWSAMKSAYLGWNGTGTVVVGNKDLLSDYTAQSTRPGDSGRLNEVRVDTNHPIARILGWSDFKGLWKY